MDLFHFLKPTFRFPLSMWTGPDGFEYTWAPSTTTPGEILVCPHFSSTLHVPLLRRLLRIIHTKYTHITPVSLLFSFHSPRPSPPPRSSSTIQTAPLSPSTEKFPHEDGTLAKSSPPMVNCISSVMQGVGPSPILYVQISTLPIRFTRRDDSHPMHHNSIFVLSFFRLFRFSFQQPMMDLVVLSVMLHRVTINRS